MPQTAGGKVLGISATAPVTKRPASGVRGGVGSVAAAAARTHRGVVGGLHAGAGAGAGAVAAWQIRWH
jgi:hypothetical protein|eukprot:COSAG01_NODE_2980_length_6758_cov_25.187416_3_plen_68_part_00